MFRTNNPGNIRPGQHFRGELAPQNGYSVFDTPEHGLRAVGVDLLTKWHNALDTVDEIIARYAPSSENNTAAYIADVCKRIGVQHDDITNLTDPVMLGRFIKAIIVHENGSCPYADSAIADAARAALEAVPV